MTTAVATPTVEDVTASLDTRIRWATNMLALGVVAMETLRELHSQTEGMIHEARAAQRHGPWLPRARAITETYQEGVTAMTEAEDAERQLGLTTSLGDARRLCNTIHHGVNKVMSAVFAAQVIEDEVFGNGGPYSS